MSGNNVALILCLGVLAAVGIPVLIYMGVRGGGGMRGIDVLRGAADTFRNPWKKEDEDLEELARLTERLNRKGD